MYNIIHFYSCITGGVVDALVPRLPTPYPSITAPTLTVPDIAACQRTGCITWDGVETLHEY